MRYIKLALLSFVLLFILFTLISLFIPSRIRISRSITIAAREDSVMARLDDIRQWKDWYPGMDTLHAEPLEEKEGKLIAAKLPGNVTVVLTETKPDEILSEFRSTRRKAMVNGWKSFAFPGGDSIILHWYIDFRSRWYPWEKFSSLLVQRNYGVRLENGLIKLKSVVENKAER